MTRPVILGNKIEFTPKFIINGTLSLFATILIVSSFIVIANVQNANGFYAFQRMWGTRGLGDGQFLDPIGVAVDSSENVFVADFGNHRIQKFLLQSPCPTGTTQIVAGVCFVTKWGTEGLGDGQFDLPTSVALDSSGNLFVGDFRNDRIQMFKFANPCPPGTTQIVAGVCFVTKWGTEGSGNGQFDGPRGVAIDSLGNIFVADSQNDRIQEFVLLRPPCPPGMTQIVAGVCFVTQWGFQGSGIGQFREPSGVAIDDSSGRKHLYVADLGNDRIQMFELALPCPPGTTQIVAGVCFVTQWGTLGSGIGQFLWGPFHVAVDSSGNVFANDAGNHRIQKFTNGGFFVTAWGTQGSGNAQFSFPYGIATFTTGPVFQQDYVYVADSGNDRIQIFKWEPDVHPGVVKGSLENSTVTK
jgi:DNA-binding beta-propeller fold protein YncE